jgi:plastocyanin
MKTCHGQIDNGAWMRFASVGLSSLFGLGVCTQMLRPAVATPAAAVESNASISIVNFEFTPGEITIAPGDRVTWTNDDGAPHGLEYHDGAEGTNLLLPGATFSRRFDRPGTYDYNCSVHPYMTGRVVVRAE